MHVPVRRRAVGNLLAMAVFVALWSATACAATDEDSPPDAAPAAVDEAAEPEIASDDPSAADEDQPTPAQDPEAAEAADDAAPADAPHEEPPDAGAPDDAAADASPDEAPTEDAAIDGAAEEPAADTSEAEDSAPDATEMEAPEASQADDDRPSEDRSSPPSDPPAKAPKKLPRHDPVTPAPERHTPRKSSTSEAQAERDADGEAGGGNDDAGDADDETGPLRAASLKGVRPGKTTRKQLHVAWGAPKKVEKAAGATREIYAFRPFDRVHVIVENDVVEALSMYLEKPAALAAMAKQFQVAGFDPVELANEQGERVGYAYPERGVMFGFATQTEPPVVFEIVVEPIAAQPFLDRAEQRMATRFADCMADLKQALELAPDNARIHHLHAELTLRAGDLEQAMRSAEKALELEGKNYEHRLLLAKVLAASGDYPRAIRRVREVVDSGPPRSVVMARAFCQWGDCLAACEEHDYRHAMEQHQQAIKVAEPLAGRGKFAVRRAAKEVLVDAHLAVAYDIAWGRWQQKSKIVPKWIDRAAAYAEDLVVNERDAQELRLRVHERGLAALVGIADPPEASTWIRGITQFGRKMYDEADDPSYKAHLAWRLAVAINDAVEVEAARRHFDKAVALGQTALELFDEGKPAAEQSPTRDYLRGRLCYRVGAIFAIEKSEHKQALVWFDRAVPLLESPVPAYVVDCGKQGETFVSMAVSYWEENNRREALRLTTEGVKLMEQAAKEGLLERDALVIPYGNLANMHEKMGDADAAREYSELAKRSEETVKE